ncbi:CPBP family glutamic-type intramembrane protease, partial [Burkholderia cenocepacia]|nr:CPBP family glutamic-type intramembrane protease [Burkholderia cenocepacia]
ALAFGMVGWAPKWPPSGWLWLANNLLLVTLAEEALFRGYVQGGLTRVLRAYSWGPWVALALKLTDDEIATLERPYVPHAVAGFN